MNTQADTTIYSCKNNWEGNWTSYGKSNEFILLVLICNELHNRIIFDLAQEPECLFEHIDQNYVVILRAPGTMHCHKCHLCIAITCTSGTATPSPVASLYSQLQLFTIPIVVQITPAIASRLPIHFAISVSPFHIMLSTKNAPVWVQTKGHCYECWCGTPDRAESPYTTGACKYDAGGCGCDVTRSALAKIEVGQRHIYPDEIIALRGILKATYEEIFAWMLPLLGG